MHLLLFEFLPYDKAEDPVTISRHGPYVGSNLGTYPGIGLP